MIVSHGQVTGLTLYSQKCEMRIRKRFAPNTPAWVQDPKYDAAFHEKPMFAGFLSRTPQESYALIRQNLFLQYCSRNGGRTIVDLPPDSAYTSRGLTSALLALRSLGARYIVVRYGRIAPGNPAAVRFMLEQQLRLRKVSDDHYITVYAVPGT